MKPENKNLFYSLLLAMVLVMFLVGYFIFMLPSLYLDYMDDRNLEGVVEQQRAYLNAKSYDTVALKNPTGCFSVEIPDKSDEIFFINAYVSVKLTAESQELQEILQRVKDVFQNQEQEANESMQVLTDYLADALTKLQKPNLPVSVDILSRRDREADFRNEEVVYHRISDDILVIVARAEDEQNQYTTYFALTNVEDGIVLSVLPAMSTRMSEIRTVVMNSLPMIVMVIVLLVLLFSYLYSNGIMKPLFAELEHKNEELDEKNNLLREENEHQEMFLRASSHQLKTPISAALLLVDGMINQVGKFRDYETYLPKVKEHLLSMRKMVEDILNLNRAKEQLQKQKVDMSALLQTLLAAYEVKSSDRTLRFQADMTEKCMVEADADMLMKILDNLLSNAVCYAEEGSSVFLRLREHELEIKNTGHIPEEIADHIFEPFVSGSTASRSHGLGLYIASYYAKLLHLAIEVYNLGEWVVTSLHF